MPFNAFDKFAGFYLINFIFSALMSSSNEPKPVNLQEGDIDLIFLLARIVQIIRKRFVLLLIILAVGVFLGSLGYFVFKPVFTTKMMAQSKVLTDVEIKGIIETLDELLDEDNFEELSSRLKMDIKTVKKINKIKALSIKDLDKDFTQKQKDSIFVIEARVSDNKIITEFENKLVNYLSENEYAKKRIALYKVNQEKTLERTRLEAAKLDSLKTTVKKLLESGESKNIYFDPGAIYFQSLALYKEELKIKENLVLADQIQIIENFTRFRKPTSFNLLKSIVAGLVSGFVFWIALVIFLELADAVRKLAKNQ